MAKTDFELQDGEVLLYQGTLNSIKGKLNVQEGTGYLTNKRLVRYQGNTMLKAMIGLLALFFKQKIDFDIPLNEISAIKRKQTGLNKKNAFYLTTAAGTEMQLICFKMNDLIEAFKKAYDRNPKLSFSELGQGEWQVQAAAQGVAINGTATD